MFSKFFIDRPIFATVISIFIIMLGAITIPILPIEKTPDITPPTIVVRAVYPGADAETIAETVATPLEEQINGVDHMLYMSSKSSNDGVMELTVTFEVGTNVDMATVLVQNKVAMAEALLPEEVKRQGVTVEKQSTNIVLVVSMVSPDDSRDALYVSNYVNIQIKDILTRVPGVGQVIVWGAQDFGMRLWLDPEQLKARSLSVDDVLAAVREQNIQVAGGQIGTPPIPAGQQFQYNVKTLGRLKTPEQFENIVIKSEQGRLLRLKEVARVELGAQSYNQFVQLKGKPSVAIGIFQQPGANALDVSKGIHEVMEELKKDFPGGVGYRIEYDTTRYISESIKEVFFTLFVAIGLVILTVFIFLEDFRATLIPSVTIPVSLIGTFAVMYALGMSINALTLFGLVLVIGIVVDDSIVVVENVMRIIEEEKLPAKEATVKAMGQITGPVVATTLVLLAVFVPTALVGGISGRLYSQFAMTIAVATVFSSINALTLSPALCGLFLRPIDIEKRPLFFRLFNRFFHKMTNGYMAVVQWILRKTFYVMVVFAAMAVVTVFGFKVLPTGFLPNEDEGFFIIEAKLPDGASLERTAEVMAQVNMILDNTPGVDSYVSVGGLSFIDGILTPNSGVYFVTLIPWDERETPELQIEAVIAGVEPQLFGISDAMIFAVTMPPIMGLGTTSGFEMQLQDRAGVGFEALQQAGEMLFFRGMSDPVYSGIPPSFRAGVPELYIDIDRVKAKSLGVPLTNIFSTLSATLGTAYVNDFNLFGRTYKVMAQADQNYRNTVDDILRMEVRNARGDMVPLKTLATVRNSAGPLSVTHFNLYPSNTFSGSAKPGYSSGQAIEHMKKVCAENLPRGISYQWSGMTYQQLAAGDTVLFIFLMAGAFVFLFLAAQYESWTIPLAIILTVPIAMFGAVLLTFVRGFDNNIYTQIGLVLLIGLASKTAILLVEFAKQHHEEGHTIMEAAIAAARLRFRPILMTALSFVLGVVPLVIATGAGAVSRRALGTAVFGGMLAATVIGVFLMPVFYVVVQRMTEKTVEIEHKVADKLHHSKDENTTTEDTE
ncbi:MAG: efflux RND transporter permease subunit [Planctomycetota bacterium]|jgi:HAE1 family hydrophobic/amphiphilic exporter-1